MLLKWCFLLSSVLSAVPSRSTPSALEREPCDETFDFIVVGSGPGGGVVASRLAKAGFSTAVLDAGPDYGSDPTHVDVQVPLLWPAATINPSIEWAFRVKNTEDAEQQNVLYPRSSNIGGCALHNAMQAAYPYPEFFKSLQDLTNDPEYNEILMRQRFMNIEKNEYGQTEAQGHGTQGFLSTSFPDFGLVSPDPQSEFYDQQFLAVIGAFATKYPGNVSQADLGGISINPDINAPGLNELEGLHFCPASVSPSKGYKRSGVYNLLKETENTTETLAIKPNSFVKQVLFMNPPSQGKGVGLKPIAYGVKVQEGTALYSVSTGTKSMQGEKTYCAEREVIVAGGAFNTPQILKLSGVGPADELNELDIEVKADLPGVGKNLRDKLEVTLNFEMGNVWELFQNLADAGCSLDPATLGSDPCFRSYLNGTTPSIFTSTSILFNAMLKSDSSMYPDLYIQVAPSEFIRYQDGWVQDAFSKFDVLTVNTATAVSSEGEVTLNSADPFESVNIDFKGYTDGDLEKIAKLVLELRQVVGALENVFVFVEELRPGFSDQTSLEDAKEWVRKNGWGHHACCTAKIGADSDSDAVLDGQFRVRKVKNLRVVDASAFPAQPGFFPTVPIMMLAEKAADDIIAEHSYTV